MQEYIWQNKVVCFAMTIEACPEKVLVGPSIGDEPEWLEDM